jgi:exopolysaccharide biosynthesis polyprenyl glycosylphosphotransferase
MSVIPRDAAVAVAVDDGAVLRSYPRKAHGLRPRGWLMRRLLLAADAVGLFAAFSAALLISPPVLQADVVQERWEIAFFVLSLPLWVLLFQMQGLYDRDEERTDHSTVDDMVGVFQVVTLGTWSFLVLTHLAGLPHPSLSRLVMFWLIAVLLVPLLRAAMRIFGRRQAAYVQNVIIVGSGHVARTLHEKIDKHPEYGLRLVGFVDQDNGASPNGAGTAARLGTTDALAELVRNHDVHRVVIAFSRDSHEQTLGVIRAMQGTEVQIDIVPRLFEVLGTGAQIHTIEGIPLMGLPIPHFSNASRFQKRALDLLGAAVGVVLIAPLFLVTAICIKLDSRGPVFFRQERMGSGDRTFRVFKFRTMVRDADDRKEDLAHLNMHNGRDPRMFKVPDDPRVTRVGRFLRRWRIDELPQLLNVIAGDMSLVGPRPLILDEDRHIERWARRRLDLKPGMTGLWQVLGASDIPFEEMTKLDYLYVTNWSLREDLRLIALTLPALMRARAAY